MVLGSEFRLEPWLRQQPQAWWQALTVQGNPGLQEFPFRLLLPELMKGGGRLVHINGLQGLIRVRPPVLYATVEAAVRGLCESLRWEAAPHGVHVGFITLGSVANTEMPTPDLSVLHTDRNRDRLSRDEVADAVLFMLSRPEGVNVDEMVLTPLRQILWNT